MTTKEAAKMDDKDINHLFIYPGTTGGDHSYYLIAENGEALASHWCSGPGFAPGDLHNNRPERKEEYEKRFGEYEVYFIDKQDHITEEELFARNQERKKMFEEE